jgi:plastocyanin domain-containing protein
MKTKYAAFLVVAIVLVFGIFMMKSPGVDSVGTGDIINDPVKKTQGSGSIQEITLSMKNYNYYPQTVKVKVNEPVRIYLDNSVGGCYRSFTIRSLGISKHLQTPKDYVEFTPTEKGTFGFACSMGMGTGTLIVE